MTELFWDDREGGFFYTPEGGEDLILRDKQIYDSAIPSSNSVAALNLLRLARMTGDTTMEEAAHRLLKAFSGMVADFPSAYAHFLLAVDFAVGPAKEIVVAGDAGDDTAIRMLDASLKAFVPNRTVMFRRSGDEAIIRFAPFLEPMMPVEGKAAAYVCENFTCRKPLTDLSELLVALNPVHSASKS